ncbi:MAG: NAD(P)/FAD-dependent oxidoreductase [Syntrophobacterales bacterium]|nr:NAD(P)/FAD-dependent oxidoreductase [Syntrophobacterales bacterium]
MYDTIVLGNDPASLIAAVVLASHGKKALLLTMDNVQDSFSESGYTFDIDPFPWTGMNRGEVFRQLLSHLGITPEDHVLDPALQIIFQNHRIDLSGNTELDLKEIEREFPNEGATLLNFYSSAEKISSFASGLIDKNLHLQPETLRDYINLFRNIPGITLKKKAFNASLEDIRENPLLKKMLEVQVLLLSNLDPRDISPISFARTFLLSLNGLSYPKGGRHHLTAKLKKKFEADGGVIERCSTFELDTERVIKINMRAEGSDMPAIYGKNIIISTKYEKFASLLEGNRELSVFRKKYDKIKASLYPFTIHIGVHDGCIPEKMGVHVVVTNETKSIENGNPLFLETSEPGDILRAPDGKRAISVTSFLKNSPSKFNNSDLEKIAESMLENLGSFLPFLKENLDFMNIEKSIDISRSYHKIINDKYIMKDPLIGMSFLSGRTPLKNVFLAGGILMPGLGFEGEIISGATAARLAMGENQT